MNAGNDASRHASYHAMFCLLKTCCPKDKFSNYMYVLEPDTWERLTFLTGKLSVSVSCANYTEVGNYFWEQARFLGAMRHVIMGLCCIGQTATIYT